MEGQGMGRFFLFRSGALFFILYSAMLCGCSVNNGTHYVPLIKGVERIAILPVDRASSKPAGERPSCNISGGYSGVYTIPLDAAERATRILNSLLRADTRFFEVTEGHCIGFLSAALASDINRSRLKIIQMYGKELGADAVLYCKINRYRDRVGNDYSADIPASVAFTMSLVRVSDGAVLWRYSFDETQQALTENLFSFSLYRSEGMKWLTASELMKYGLKRAVTDLVSRMP
jgi:hypothetical protein